MRATIRSSSLEQTFHHQAVDDRHHVGPLDAEALRALARWTRNPEQSPPIGPRFAVQIVTSPAPAALVERDPNTGNAIGGIRLPPVAVPIETLTGIRPPAAVAGNPNCVLFGAASPWDGNSDPWDGVPGLDPAPSPQPSLQVLYGTKLSYLIGANFYLMAPLEGFAPSQQLPGDYSTNPAWRRAMGEELMRGAAALGEVDYEAVGLGDLGKPEGWHERQVERWRSQLDGYRSMPNYDGALPHVDEVGRWLTDNLPKDRRIGIVHGDFQFANVMFSLDAPRISGVVDWELTSLGDPLLDLGWILTSWWEPGDPEGKKPLLQPWQDFLSRAELIRLYGEITGRDLNAVPWFFTLGCYKLACLLEGTYARSKQGQVPANVGQHVHAYALWLMNKAAQIVAGRS